MVGVLGVGRYNPHLMEIYEYVAWSGGPIPVANVRRIFSRFTFLCVLCFSMASPVLGQENPGENGEEEPLPTATVVDVDASEQKVLRLGLPDFFGDETYAVGLRAIVENDFRIMPGYRVLGPADISHDVRAPGLDIHRPSWFGYGVQGVIKGEVDRVANSPDPRVHAVLHFHSMVGVARPPLVREYDGAADGMRKFAHGFVDDVLEAMTELRGPFSSSLVFARRLAPGRKDIFRSDMDGYGVTRISRDGGIAMLPSFDDQHRVWFTRIQATGMFITHSGSGERPVIHGDGIHMAPEVCGDRVYFVSSRDGNSEIYSSSLEGRNVRRHTSHPAIDVSPSCGPGGKVAFVSTRHGSPQIFVLDGRDAPARRVTFRGTHNQTPAFCSRPEVPMIAFTGRDEGLDIFTVHLGTGEYTRVTQGQGNNKDPVFSPDCRLIAFVSDRRGGEGVYVSSPQGFRQTRVVEGGAETVDWSSWWR